MSPSTGWASARRRSNGRSRASICAPARWCYDVSSSYVEGRCCELAQRGYNRDGKKGKLQIVYGLLCAGDGCPVAIEAFARSPPSGNSAGGIV